MTSFFVCLFVFNKKYMCLPNFGMQCQVAFSLINVPFFSKHFSLLDLVHKTEKFPILSTRFSRHWIKTEFSVTQTHSLTQMSSTKSAVQSATVTSQFCWGVDVACVCARWGERGRRSRHGCPCQKRFAEVTFPPSLFLFQYWSKGTWGPLNYPM